MSERCSVPRSPADSIDRSPASRRSRIRWLKNTVLIRSSGISMPDFDSQPRRVMIRSVVSTNIVVTQFTYQ